MSEPFLERMSRFTPYAGRLDHDALLFAAGRGSARPNRGWKTLATILASTQALSLGLLWPRPTRSISGLTAPVTVATVPFSRSNLETQTPDALTGPGAWSAHRRLMDPDKDEVAIDSVTLIDSGPPLKIMGPHPPSLLN
jgi:hypothetical protein